MGGTPCTPYSDIAAIYVVHQAQMYLAALSMVQGKSWGQLKDSKNALIYLPTFYECLYQINVMIFWQNLASLAKLDSLERLHTIQMEGNPVWSLPDYSNYVVSALPHLKVLDQQEITADLRANSAKWKNSEATVKNKSFIKLILIYKSTII